MKIFVGSDHAGFKLKQKLLQDLREEYQIVDCGSFNEDSVDYPDIVAKVTQAVLLEEALGILICGTGVGMSITANKIAGIRAALCQDPLTARLAREHNNANILTLGARIIGPYLAQEITRSFINSSFAGGRHQMRLEKIEQIEKYTRRNS